MKCGDFFPLRTCNLRFPVKSPRRPCVHHQIGQCLAPCAGGVSEEAYRAILARVIDFFERRQPGTCSPSSPVR